MLLEIILAIIPIAWLIISMAGLKMAGYKSCGIGLVIAIVEGVAVYHMTVPEAITGTLEGVVSAVWPICVIIVGAMFLYNMSLRTGAMDVIKAMLASVSNDKRVAALVIGWGFSNFMEGIAGFGTAVAIPAAMLVALGFNPVTACVICLIGNAASPEFGAIGTPTLSAANTAFPTTITGAARCKCVCSDAFRTDSPSADSSLCCFSICYHPSLRWYKGIKGCCRYYTCICIIICYSFLSCSHIRRS